MPLREHSWYPWLSAALWGLLVLALVFVNSGSVVLALGLGVAVALLSHRIERSRQQ